MSNKEQRKKCIKELIENKTIGGSIIDRYVNNLCFEFEILNKLEDIANALLCRDDMDFENDIKVWRVSKEMSTYIYIYETNETFVIRDKTDEGETYLQYVRIASEIASPMLKE